MTATIVILAIFLFGFVCATGWQWLKRDEEQRDCRIEQLKRDLEKEHADW